jgi:D-alanyl-D-alanine carboxypeptidase
VKTFNQEYAYSEKHKYIYLENQTNLLTTYPGVLGVKTGYTEEAGLCLVTYSVNEGRELLGVVLNSVDRKGDMITMLDYGFSLLGVKVEHPLLDQ